jgi:hypothetical protein
VTELEYVRAAAARVYTPEGVEVWMDAPNRMLDGATPRQCVDAGDGGKVLGLIAALAEGVTG